jgi:hypothetical protein
MSTKKQHPIKAVLNFRKLTAEVVLSTSTHIFAEIYNNPNYTPPQAPVPPVDPATLKSANDALAAAIAEAVDGGKKAIAHKNAQKEVVVKLLTQLAHYAKANCKEDMTIFLSSGFTAKSSTRTKTPPVSEAIRKIEPGPDSGHMLVSLMKYPGAASYEVRFAPVGADDAPGGWTIQAIGNVIKSSSTISGLKPATTYVFQARAVKKTGGYSDWSDSVTRVAV